MRKLNNVKQMGKTHTHRKAMIANMITSLLNHERIVTTKQKAKVLKSYSEKFITRAKNAVFSEDSGNKILHQKRVVLRTIKDKDVVTKLFDDIAHRVKERNGGYTRIYLLGRRPGDSAEKAIIELVDKKAEVPVVEDKKSAKK
jgi:large subunit ribosomal protein L17